MLATRLDGKIGHSDLNAPVGARWSHVGDLALPDEPGEVALAVPRDPGGLGEVHESVGFGEKRGFDLGRRPLEGAGAALGAEGLTQLLSLGADVGDCLLNGAALRAQKGHTPQRVLPFGGC